MDGGALLGVRKWTLPVPPALWRRQILQMTEFMRQQLSFMTDDHRRIHKFVVVKLTESRVPLKAELIAQTLNLSLELFGLILDDLEKRSNLFSRNAGGDIIRAYPVTLEKTPHRMAISTGKELYADEALGALAMPFIQKQVSGVAVFGHITTECTYCTQPLHIMVDSNASCKVVEKNVAPVVFSPIPAKRSTMADISQRFLTEAAFYCSAEHAIRYRKETGGGRGIFLPLKNAMDVNRSLQNAIFGFEND
jgi:hypothetical protein